MNTRFDCTIDFHIQCLVCVFSFSTERRRSEEELREMDSKNKIMEDMASVYRIHMCVLFT